VAGSCEAHDWTGPVQRFRWVARSAGPSI